MRHGNVSLPFVMVDPASTIDGVHSGQQELAVSRCSSESSELHISCMGEKRGDGLP